MSFKDRLAGMQQSYNDSQSQYDSMFGGVKIAPGNYIAQLQKAVIVESKTSQKLMIKREHIITDGEFQGHVVYDYMHLESPMGFTFTRKWIEQMGYEAPDDPAELEDLVEAISDEGAAVKVNVKHSGDFVNVSVVELLDGPADAGTAETTGTTETTETAPVEKAKEEVKEEVKEEDPLNLSLLAFCEAQDIEVEEDDTNEILAERISAYDWPEKELTVDEVKMFKSANIEHAIQKPKPTAKKKTVKKKVAKKR